jgi:predicted Rossmann fold nucleotide-binding protein DprA/Smf involved in DNA uptake
MEAELRHYAAQGISIITLEDKLYPKGLKKHAPFPCPPLFYAVGDLNLGQKDCVGFVGSRNLNPEDIDFTKDTVKKVLSQGYGVVSGGARGIDTVAEQEAMLRGGFAVEFTAEALCQKLKNEDTLRNIREGRLLLLSAVAPTVGFSTGIAMMRNRFIYTHSQSTVVVHAATGKGGTWAGATDALKHHLCPVLCWDQNYEGNQSLIRQGATSIDSHWSGTLPQRAAFYGNAYPQGLTISQFPLYPVSFFPEDQQEESWDQNQLTLDELMSFEE